MPLEKIVYTARASATGGRDGQAVSDDGVLNIKLGTPKEMGGAGGPVSNPEQLFAATYSACFIGALKFAAGKEKIAVPADTKVSAAVGLGPIPTGFNIQVHLDISMPGMDRAVATDLMHKAHIVCPFSNATRGNVDVTLALV